ncbi:MAG: AbrB/MazE/SpoVT family DNA-binding domain-containing protein [Patescibacteria group bacterium]
MVTITIPKNLTEKGALVVVPQKEYDELKSIYNSIDKDQLWFWTKEWQKKEREADIAIKNGKVSGPYKNWKELKKALDKLKK